MWLCVEQLLQLAGKEKKKKDIKGSGTNPSLGY